MAKVRTIHRKVRTRVLTGGEKPSICAATARWRSGYAEDCKSLHPGSIPGRASRFSRQGKALRRIFRGIGREPLKLPCESTPCQFSLNRP